MELIERMNFFFFFKEANVKLDIIRNFNIEIHWNVLIFWVFLGGLLLQLASNSVLEDIIIVHIFLQKKKFCTTLSCSLLSRWSLICIAWLLLLQSVWVSPFFHSFWFWPELNKLGWSPAVISPQPFIMKLNWKEYSNKILPGIVSARFINGPTNCAAKIDT